MECIVCEVCGKASDPSRLLLCDDCDISYHTYCLDPPLQTVPKGGWKCKWCVGGAWGAPGGGVWHSGLVLTPRLAPLLPQVRVLCAVWGGFPRLPLRVAEQLHPLRALRQPGRVPLLPREVRGGRPAHPVPALRSVSAAALGLGGGTGVSLRLGFPVGWPGVRDGSPLPAGGCTRHVTASSRRRRWSRLRTKASTAAPASPTWSSQLVSAQGGGSSWGSGGIWGTQGLTSPLCFSLCSAHASHGGCLGQGQGARYVRCRGHHRRLPGAVPGAGRTPSSGFCPQRWFSSLQSPSISASRACG